MELYSYQWVSSGQFSRYSASPLFFAGNEYSWDRDSTTSIKSRRQVVVFDSHKNRINSSSRSIDSSLLYFISNPRPSDSQGNSIIRSITHANTHTYTQRQKRRRDLFIACVGNGCLRTSQASANFRKKPRSQGFLCRLQQWQTIPGDW